MIPIHELLSRIRWDEDFGRAEFLVGYYDRVSAAIVRVPFQALYFDSEDHFDFQLLDEEGVSHTIPLHRIREVWRNGERIWHRQVE